MFIRLCSITTLALGLAACQIPVTVPAPTPEQQKPIEPIGKPVDVYNHLGSGIQCKSGGPTLADRQNELKKANVKELANSCASDGRMYAAVCGGSTSNIHVFTIPAEDVAKAQAAGFRLLSELPEAEKYACP